MVRFIWIVNYERFSPAARSRPHAAPTLCNFDSGALGDRRRKCHAASAPRGNATSPAAGTPVCRRTPGSPDD
eukprot:6015380-Pyramimonas_sp.AAC.1